MEWVKTTAKTLPEAIDLALDNLGVDESEAEIVVLEEPRPGLFGRMRGTARVEARVKPKEIPPKNERSRGRGRKGSDGGKGGRGDRNRNDRNRGDRNKNKGGRNRSGGGNRNGGGRGGQDRSGQQSGQGSGNKGRDQNRDRDRAGSGQNGGGQGGGGQRKSRDRNQNKDGSPGRSNKSEQSHKPKEDTPVEEVAAHLESFLSGLTEAFGFDSDVTVDSSEQDVLVGRIEGQHGLLVGPKGRTLDAVQELARISCQRTVPSSVRIKVDVGGYRQQRVDALTAFAGKAADKAVEDGTEVALEPMSPADRKAVHDALSEDDRVETRSVGTEPRRKVLVVPVVDEVDDDDDLDEPDDDAVTADADAGENGSAPAGDEEE